MAKVAVALRLTPEWLAEADAQAAERKVSRQVLLEGFVGAGLYPRATPVEALGPNPSVAAVERSVRAVTAQGPVARDNSVAMARQRRLNESSQRSRSK